MEPVKIAVPVPVDRDTGLTPLISPRMRVGAAPPAMALDEEQLSPRERKTPRDASREASNGSERRLKTPRGSIDEDAASSIARAAAEAFPETGDDDEPETEAVEAAAGASSDDETRRSGERCSAWCACGAAAASPPSAARRRRRCPTWRRRRRRPPAAAAAEDDGWGVRPRGRTRAATRSLSGDAADRDGRDAAAAAARRPRRRGGRERRRRRAAAAAGGAASDDDDGEGWDSGYDSRKKSGQARRQNGKHSRNLKQSVQRAYAIEARQAQRGGGPRPQKSRGGTRPAAFCVPDYCGRPTCPSH